jgi:hypothetical protein
MRRFSSGRERPVTYSGKVKDGVVILDDPQSLPEGTEVTVRPVRKPSKPAPSNKPSKSLRPGLRKFAGKAKGLPPDASVNLDHYLYGHPKQ